MGSNPCRKIQLLGIAHPVVGITVSGTEGAPGDGTLRGSSGEEKAKLGLTFILCKFWVEKPNFVLCKEQRVVIKLVYVE